METLGRHVILELWECNPNLLDSIDTVKHVMVEAAVEAGADVREVAFHKFHPQGVSGVVVISESHLTIHSFPEHGYASVDVYTCGDLIDPQVAAKYLADHLQAKKIETMLIHRGTGPLRIEEPEVKKTEELVR